MSIRKTSDKFYVALGSSIDLNRLSEMTISEQLLERDKPNGLVYFEVENLSEASKFCRQFIKRFHLGSSNWTGGSVIDQKFQFIANITYNGRIWNNENWEVAKEVAL